MEARQVAIQGDSLAALDAFGQTGSGRLKRCRGAVDLGGVGGNAHDPQPQPRRAAFLAVPRPEATE